MARRSLLAAALASSALLALGSPSAFAQAEEAAPVTPDSTVTITPDPVTPVTPALADSAPPQDVLQDVSPVNPPEAEAAPPAPAPEPVVVPEILVAAPPEVVSPEPAPITPPEIPEPASPPAAETPQPVAEAPDHSAPADSPADAPAASGSVASRPSVGQPQGTPAPDSASTWLPRLEQALPAVERDLRRVQADVESIRRQLNSGATPLVSDLNRLRSRLERLEPVLLALDGRIDRLGVVSEETRLLLHRVQVQLAETQVSTAGLIAALRSSGLHGPALDALLRELESFGALGSALDLGPAATPFAPTALTIDPAPPAAVVPALATGGSPSEPRVGPPRAAKERETSAPDAPAPWPAPAESFSASASDALSVGGAAALIALLIAFFLPRLTARLELAPGRGHVVASVLAIERPD